MNETVPSLRGRGLTKKFGSRLAVADVSLTLNSGDCLALFGPNGAGKSTLLRMLGGLQQPTRGDVEVQGQAVGGAAARRMVGLISHHTLLYAALTAKENVRFAAECHGIVNADAMAAQALNLLQIADRADTAVRMLSRGMQQRVSIARALVHSPRVVLLDEPYTGLDDSGARALTSALQELRDNGATLVLVTHQIGEGLALANHAAVMVSGRIVSHETRAFGAFDNESFTDMYRSHARGSAA